MWARGHGLVEAVPLWMDVKWTQEGGGVDVSLFQSETRRGPSCWARPTLSVGVLYWLGRPHLREIETVAWPTQASVRAQWGGRGQGRELVREQDTEKPGAGRKEPCFLPDPLPMSHE